MGSADIVLRSTVTLTDSYDGTSCVGPGTSEHDGVWVTICVRRGVVTVTVGAGVAGGGDELWAHPAKKMQSMSVREIR